MSNRRNNAKGQGTEVGKELRAPQSEAFHGVQLSLFQHFLCNTEDERARLSNTIELWDGVPKYFVSRKEMNELRTDGFLPTIEREFVFRGRGFRVRIRPARLADENDRDKEFYPSAREELVEDALRKIAVEQNYGFYDDTPPNQQSGVVFSLHMLRRELSSRGHSLSYQEVIESLDILSGCHVGIIAADGKGDYQAPILSGLLRVSRREYREDHNARWVAFFNPLVTQSIRMLTYRQFDYQRMMSHRSQLARWLHKRLAHNYSNASLTDHYTITFSAIRRDSGLLEYKRMRDAVRKLDDAFHELQERQVLMSFNRKEKRGARNAIIEVTYSLMPHHKFIGSVRAANKRRTDAVASIEVGRR
jgi:hypothetical protein